VDRGKGAKGCLLRVKAWLLDQPSEEDLEGVRAL